MRRTEVGEGACEAAIALGKVRFVGAWAPFAHSEARPTLAKLYIPPRKIRPLQGTSTDVEAPALPIRTT